MVAMPRELLHWSVLKAAEKIIALRDPECRVAKVLCRHWNEAQIGAIAHDAPYFYGGGGTPFEEVASLLHGTESYNPGLIITSLLETSANRTDTDPLLAFTCGMISHAVTDSIFHPWVFHVSGDYYHPDPEEQLSAAARHRALEVFLDEWCHQTHPESFKSLLTVLRSLRSDSLIQICTALATNLESSERTASSQQWHRSFWWIAVACSCFQRDALGWFINALELTGWHSLKGIESLFRYQRRFVPEAFVGIQSYKHPVTGEWLGTTLEELFQRSVEGTAEIFTKIIQNGELTLSLPSLNYGIMDAAPSSAQFFAEKWPEFLA